MNTFDYARAFDEQVTSSNRSSQVGTMDSPTFHQWPEKKKKKDLFCNK